MQIFVAQTKPSPVAQWHVPSVVISLLFLVNLVLMPFVYYVSDPIMAPHDYVIPWKVLANDLSATAAMRSRYTQLLETKTYYSNEGVVAMRADFPSSNNSSCTDLQETDLPGSVLCPTTILDHLKTAVCSSSPFQSLWIIHFMGFPVSFGMTWTLVAEDATSVFYVFSPIHQSISWCIATLLLRCFWSCYIVRRAWLDYYSHVWRLRSCGHRLVSDRTTIIVGEPTSLILANKWIVLAFVVDLIAHPASMGAATVRTLYSRDTWATIQGVVFLNRFVWFSYAAIWLGNEYNLRYTPVSTTACAWMTTIVTLLLVRAIGAVKIAFVISSFAFNLIESDGTLDVTICTLASSLYLVSNLRRKKASRSSVTSPMLPVKKITPELKQRLLLWLYGYGGSASGSFYRKLELDKNYQRFPMLRQGSSDCFIADRATGAIRQLCLASRVKLPAQGIPFKDDQAKAMNGVVTVFRYISNCTSLQTDSRHHGSLASWITHDI
ncbi:unnamed protein product [Aphanomyces euteiches]|uniref:Uncharacterized protein n=1 Tax=Aphanomyces euteiches TaxID=100861 RepID=A0A6G0X6T3_9STRA|nr:hypothetical protein Ae201684_007737 [Aphanomyces euteiches]KAH9067277.1 hypothetical protein Ae201684P_021438 [Aphanomyces euteiches]KAH9142911.1 hypothetical protein AeRB84_013031 [Aphanomyces euteiches]